LKPTYLNPWYFVRRLRRMDPGYEYLTVDGDWVVDSREAQVFTSLRAASLLVGDEPDLEIGVIYDNRTLAPFRPKRLPGQPEEA
jgi:hypothetical protein